MERRWVLSLLLCIGIVGYFSVPAVANYVVHAHGGNGLMYRVNSIVQSATTSVGSAGGQAGSAAGGRMLEGAGNVLSAPANIMEGYNSGGPKTDNYQKDRLSGKA